MTDKTENNKVFDSKKILKVSVSFIIIHYTFIIFAAGLTTILELPGIITKCSGLPANGIPWTLIVKFVYQIGIILTGICTDLALDR